MKSKKKFSLLLVASLILLFVAVNCNNTPQKSDNIVTQNLTVKTIADTASITGVSLSPDYVSGYELGAEVDYPTEGPQSLVDSVEKFIIGELYNMFDWDVTGADAQEMIHIPFEQVIEWQGDNIVSVFINNYAPLYEKEVIGVGADYLNLKLVAQTETFVTYFAEYTDCGASCNYGYKYYTFRKRDGYLFKEIISKKKLKAFVKDHPEYKNQIAIGYDEKLGVRINEYFSMLNDGVVYIDPRGLELGELRETTIPYSEIKPYLSKEAQELIPND